jgi:small redox-active disulfide protein 2
MDVKILGTGCAKCQALERVTKEALNELGISASFEKVTDIKSIMEYDILMTPGLVVNGKVVVSGKLPGKEEIKRILQAAS